MKLHDMSNPHLLRNAHGEFYSVPVAGWQSALMFADRAAADAFASRFSHLDLTPVSMVELQKEFAAK